MGKKDAKVGEERRLAGRGNFAERRENRGLRGEQTLRESSSRKMISGTGTRPGTQKAENSDFDWRIVRGGQRAGSIERQDKTRQEKKRR